MAPTTFITTAETPLQKKALKAFLEALELPYNPEFVAKIKQSEKEIAEGKVTKMTLEEIEALCR